MELETADAEALSKGKPSPAYVVRWDGPADPANPRNWKSAKKLWHIIIASLFALSFATVMFAPGASQLADDFGITSSTVVTFTVSIYILGYVVGPLILSPLSELYGRLIIYQLCSIVYLGFTVGCALSTNTAMFLVFRFICGCAASAPLVILGGTIADLYVPNERGTAVALSCIGPLLGPALGPVMGGFVARDLGWRWTFWLILIFAGVVSVATFALMRETFEPVLLRRKAAAMRKSGENEIYDSGPVPSQLLKQTITRPIKMLLLSPVVCLLSLYSGFIYALNYVLFTTFPTVFEGTYNFSPELSGLSYLGLGLGMLASLLFCMYVSDNLLAKVGAESSSGPEQRLLPMVWFCLVLPVGFFWYGWSAYHAVHWIVPILGTLIIGVGSMTILIPTLSYLVDAFNTGGAASAIAAATIVRSLLGAFLPLAGPPLYDALGLGWGNSLLGFIALAFAPVPYFFYKYGESLRTRFPMKLQTKDSSLYGDGV